MLSVAILAGGRSERMGQDKALIRSVFPRLCFATGMASANDFPRNVITMITGKGMLLRNLAMVMYTPSLR